jgi:integration host factor subunit alpha
MSARHIPTGRLNHMALAEAVAAESGVSREIVERVLRATFDVIPRNVVAGHPVNVTNFGTWYPKVEAPRVRRNPQNGETWLAPARTKPMFRWAPKIRDAVYTDDAPVTFKKRSSR